MKASIQASLQLMGILVGAGVFTACGSATTPTVEALSTAETDAVLNSVSSGYGLSYGEPSKIIGSNGLIPIKSDGSNIDSKIRPYLDAMGVIELGTGGICSGTHVGNGYVLTAGHCFFSASDGTNRTASNRACANVKVHWGYRGSPKTGNPKPLVTKTSQCSKIIYAELSPTRDFALFKVDSAPRASVPMAIESRRTPTGTKLTILGFPSGRPLEWSQYCSLRSSQEASLNSIKTTATFVYNCDTEPGNSGSSVIAFNSQGQPYVVGIHNGAAPLGIDYNYATYAYDVRMVLRSQGFDLDQSLRISGL